MTSNDALLDKLKHWASIDAKIDPASFKCTCYDECNASVGHALQEGHGCLMSYVGRKFGSSCSSEDFKLVLVGIDHGEVGGGNFEDRRAEIENAFQIRGCNFNQHYRGVLKTAAAVFGHSAEYCQQHCKTSCQKSHGLASSECIIDRIVQANIVKCTPQDQENRTSRASWKMMQNCANHLVEELKILKPELVVFHGVKARWIVLPSIKSCGLEVNPIESIIDRHGNILYECPSLGANLLFLYHPAYGGLDRQWEAVVEPALKYLRAARLIPA